MESTTRAIFRDLGLGHELDAFVERGVREIEQAVRGLPPDDAEAFVSHFRATLPVTALDALNMGMAAAMSDVDGRRR